MFDVTRAMFFGMFRDPSNVRDLEQKSANQAHFITYAFIADAAD